MSWRSLFLENYLPGDLCSGLIICWRKSSGEMSPGEKFLGEKCDEFNFPTLKGIKMASSNVPNSKSPVRDRTLATVNDCMDFPVVLSPSGII